jgi:excisionase family DNA binding protein
VRDELQIALRIARELPPEQLPRLLGELEEIKCTALARIALPISQASSESDELLAIEEASRRLSVSKDYLYRHSGEFIFTRRMGRKLLFSRIGIERHIAQRAPLNTRQRRATLQQ